MESMYKKDFFSQEKKCDHARSMHAIMCVIYHLSHLLCVLDGSLMHVISSMCCVCCCCYTIYMYPIMGFDEVIKPSLSICNNKQRCFPYCFGDVISVNSLSKTQLEQALCLFFLFYAMLVSHYVP